ncbi:hypothetical protein BGZ83_005421 [Gryganskiella cystojenkinii]|nr:hypothetical protein BGZ83_005421 [Gryganskiella cystojenkinii]
MPFHPPSHSLVPLLLTQSRKHHRHRHSLDYNRPFNLSPSSHHPTDGSDSQDQQNNIETDLDNTVDVSDSDQPESSSPQTESEEESSLEDLNDPQDHEQEPVQHEHEYNDDNESDSQVDSDSDSDSSSLSLNNYTGEDAPSAIKPSLDELRQASTDRLALAWKDIFDRYENREPDAPDDEIDLLTGEIIVDHGVLREQQVPSLFGTMTKLGLDLKEPLEEERIRLRRRVWRKNKALLKRQGANKNSHHDKNPDKEGRSDHGGTSSSSLSSASPPRHDPPRNHRRYQQGPDETYGGEDFDNLLFSPPPKNRSSSDNTPPKVPIRSSPTRRKNERPSSRENVEFKIWDKKDQTIIGSPSGYEIDQDEDNDSDDDQSEYGEYYKADRSEHARDNITRTPRRSTGRPTATDTRPFTRESSSERYASTSSKTASSRRSSWFDPDDIDDHRGFHPPSHGAIKRSPSPTPSPLRTNEISIESAAILHRSTNLRSRMAPRTAALADSLFSKRTPTPSLIQSSSSPSPSLQTSVTTPPPPPPSRSFSPFATTIPSSSRRPSTTTTTTASTTIFSTVLPASTKRKHSTVFDDDVDMYPVTSSSSQWHSHDPQNPFLDQPYSHTRDDSDDEIVSAEHGKDPNPVDPFASSSTGFNDRYDHSENRACKNRRSASTQYTSTSGHDGSSSGTSALVARCCSPDSAYERTFASYSCLGSCSRFGTYSGPCGDSNQIVDTYFNNSGAINFV